MPKTPSIRILRRWMDLDWQLAWKGFGSRGMVLTEFAEKWGVDVKTIRRDLAMFKKLGFEIRGGYNRADDGTYQYNYVGEEALFAGTVSRIEQLEWG